MHVLPAIIICANLGYSESLCKRRRRKEDALSISPLQTVSTFEDEKKICLCFICHLLFFVFGDFYHFIILKLNNMHLHRKVALKFCVLFLYF